MGTRLLVVDGHEPPGGDPAPGRAGRQLLSIEGLTIEGHGHEGWRAVVRDVSLHLRQGEILGLIGESGAGKSTVGLAAMGYAREGCRIVSGTVTLDGIELTSAGIKTLESVRGTRIAYVAQSAASFFNPAFTIIDQFSEVLVTRKMASRAQAGQRARKIYRDLGLPDPDQIGNRYPHQLSGGQLQRAMIAMAIATNPDLIIFDEPTTALDVTTQLDVLAAVKNVMSSTAAAALYITHDLALVAQIADRLAVMRFGELVEVQPTAALLARPQQDYTRRLIREKVIETSPPPVPSRTGPILRAENICAGYGKRHHVLSNIDLTIERGHTVAIVGESGSGKSTLARVICGLLPAASGHIVFDGREIGADFKKRDKDLLRRIQLVHQLPDLALNPRQRVETIVGRPLQYFQGLGKAECAGKVRELLEMLELPPGYADRYPGQLSGGEKQRVAIARALAAKPDLIICDEVTSALDQLVAIGVLTTLSKLKAAFGISYMFITHDLKIVQSIADDIVVMRQGRVVDHGTKADVFSPPLHPYTQLLQISTPEMDPSWLTDTSAQRAALRLPEQ